MKNCAAVGGATFLSGCLGVNRAMAEKKPRPNIVLMVSDDHGIDALGCYGNAVIETPNLDALAGDGVRFTHGFCTSASCSASRSVILTGLHNHANGQYGHQHSYHHFSSFDSVTSLPVRLSRAGYRTARAGKYHVGPPKVYKFDEYLGDSSRNNLQMADICKDFINKQSGKPFFLYWCTYDPHRGSRVVEDSSYKPNAFGNEEEYPGVKKVQYDPAKVKVPEFLPDIPECRAELAQYYQSVTRLDQGIGRLTRILKDAGEYENTVVIYISDHGLAFPNAKTTLYDSGMNVPFIVRTPWQKRRGGICDAMVSFTDITPTLLDIAGADFDGQDVHGRSFKSVIDGEDSGSWDKVYASHTFHEVTMYYPMRVVRTRRYKLIWNIAHGLTYPSASDLWRSATWQAVINRDMEYYGRRRVQDFLHRPEFELYDVQNDPYEVNNLADDAKYADVLERLKADLKQFQNETDDPWVRKWRYE